MKPKRCPYEYEELRWRPIEHVVEVVPVGILASVTNKRREYWISVRHGDAAIEDEDAAQIRRYLERTGSKS